MSLKASPIDRMGTLSLVAPKSIPLLQVEPDIARYLTADDRGQAERLLVPVFSLGRGPVEFDTELRRRAAFGAIVLDGMVLQRIQLANHTTMRVHGRGDVLGRVGAAASMLISEESMSAVEGTELAVLGTEFLAVLRRWPPLAAGLHVRLAQQAERVAVQLAICQLPRVDERLLALLWWLAEAWGRVTSVGTIVPISMTHDVLGALVGARRPTVTLALGELVERGAIVRQDRGWLLLEPPPSPDRATDSFDDPSVIPAGQPVWRSDQVVAAFDHEPADHVALLDTVHRLRAEHERARLEVQTRLAELRRSRRQIQEHRRERASSSRRAPS